MKDEIGQLRSTRCGTNMSNALNKHWVGSCLACTYNAHEHIWKKTTARPTTFVGLVFDDNMHHLSSCSGASIAILHEYLAVSSMTQEYSCTCQSSSKLCGRYTLSGSLPGMYAQIYEHEHIWTRTWAHMQWPATRLSTPYDKSAKQS